MSLPCRHRLPLLLLLLCLGLSLAQGPLRAEESAPVAVAPPAKATTAAAPLADPSSPLALAATIAKVSAALGTVLGLMLLLLFLIKKLGLIQGGLGSGHLIRVIESRMIAPKKYIAVIEVGDQLLAVGIAEQGINLLTKLDRQLVPMAPPAPGPEQTGFRALLAKAMKNRN